MDWNSIGLRRWLNPVCLASMVTIGLLINPVAKGQVSGENGALVPLPDRCSG